MASDDGEHTRFPCLAWLRTSVAILVTVLVLVLLVMVITVVRRPEKISLSSYGRVLTDQRWWNQAEQRWWNQTEQRWWSQTTTKPATMVTMWVSVFAYNPSGRGSVDCNITTISIIDMPHDDFSEMFEIQRVYSPKSPSEFSVPPQTWHRDRKSVKISDSSVLEHLFHKHPEEDRFRVMVQVNTTYKAQHSAASVNVSHFCWPVTFGYVYSYADYTYSVASADVPCKTSEEMDYSVSWLSLPDGAGADGGH